jgi:hypothetical protein
MRARHIGLVAALSLSFCLSALATDPPSSQINPASGYIEVADATPVSGVFNARHVINPGAGQLLQVTIFGNASHNDAGTRLAISSAGDSWVTWWRDISPAQIILRHRTYTTGQWSSDKIASNTAEESRYPSIVHDGTTAWIAYEVLAGSTTEIAVYPGITWVDSSTNVGWVQYNYTNQTWSLTTDESYASDSVTAARGRIRSKVLSN